jgi:hypothetical protein
VGAFLEHLLFDHIVLPSAKIIEKNPYGFQGIPETGDSGIENQENSKKEHRM